MTLSHVQTLRWVQVRSCPLPLADEGSSGRKDPDFEPNFEQAGSKHGQITISEVIR